MSNTDFNADENADFGSGASGTSSTLPTGAGPDTTKPLSAQWTKLGIINEALVNSANNTVDLPDDDETDEWRVASSVYDQWLSLQVYRRDWKFATRIVGLYYVGSSPVPGYADIFAKPNDCLYFRNCWRADLADLILPATLGAPSEQYDNLPPPLDYKLVGDQIHTTATPDFFGARGDFNLDFSADFAEQTMLYGEYVPFPSQNTPFSAGFIAALRLKVEAGLFRGLNEDFSEANRCDKEAEAALAEAAYRVDSEAPRRVAFRSSLIERRRRRYGGRW